MELELHYSFGYRNSKKNVIFYDDNSLVFAAGKLCFLYNLDTGTQKLIQFVERAEITAIARCVDFIVTAVKGCPPSVCSFYPLTETKKFYVGPTSMKSNEFTAMSVSENLKFVAAQGGAPDWLLVIWFAQTEEVAIVLNPAKTPGSSVLDISFHAGGNEEIVVAGDNVLKLYESQEDAGAPADDTEEEKPLFKEIVFDKFEKLASYHTIGWPEKENLVIGSSKGEIIFFRGIDMINEVSLENDMKRCAQMNLAKIESDDKTVTSVIVTAQHLLCVFAGFAVLIYEGEEISYYTLIKCIYLSQDIPSQIIPGEMRENPDRLQNIIISLDSRDVVASTRDGQVLRCLGFANGDVVRHFSSVLPRQENDPIIGIDVAQNRPLIASCSAHRLTLWNYSNKKQELRKTFKAKIRSVAIHPTGLYIVLSFNEFCRIFSILYHDLRERKSIPYKNCSLTGFSNTGRLLATVSDSIIEIYHFNSMEFLFRLNGHAGLVTSFDWMDHDTKLVSCDSRGVLCEWDLVSSAKVSEVTAVLSYLSLAANRYNRNVIAVTSNKYIRCFNNASLQWNLECNKNMTCVVFCSDNLQDHKASEVPADSSTEPRCNFFYAGTSDGCIEFRKFPFSEDLTTVHAHAGSVSGMKYNFKYDLLITSGSDGCIFLWKTEEETSSDDGIYSNLCLAGMPDLKKQYEKSKLLRLTLQYLDISKDSEYELNSIKHEELLRKHALDHEHAVDELNERIIRVKEATQTVVFDADTKSDVGKLEVEVREEVTGTTTKLNDAYNKSDAYADETQNIIKNYEKSLAEMGDKHAKHTSVEANAIDNIRERIKNLEKTLMLEREITKQAKMTSEEDKQKTEKKLFEEAGTLNNSQIALLEEEKLKSSQLQQEIEKLKLLTEFQAEDTKCRRNIIAGQADYDIQEQIKAINVLKDNFVALERVVDSKEIKCQYQEEKFSKMRKLVKSVKKYHSVSSSAVEELLENIDLKQLQIKSCQDTIKEIETAIPTLEDEVAEFEELCFMVSKRYKKSVDGYEKKEKSLRDTQDAMSKYKSLLARSRTVNCDPMKLRVDILNHFEAKRMKVDEGEDESLLNEYDFQINKLKSIYDDIKCDPLTGQRDKALAELRLSLQNSKILKDVHGLQNDIEKYDLLLTDMKATLVLQATRAKNHKLEDELRRKIQFVIEASKKNRTERRREISKLDRLIEGQQKEIARFQKILAGKLKK